VPDEDNAALRIDFHAIWAIAREQKSLIIVNQLLAYKISPNVNFTTV
jgi:hypothetical protein